MDFDSARKQFERLTRLLQSGEISSEEYTDGVDKLAVTDEQGNHWMIGMQSGQWYRREGENWVEDDPFAPMTVSTGDLEKTSKRPRRRLALLLLLVVALTCVGVWYFGMGGAGFMQFGSSQQTRDAKVLTQVAILEAQASQTLDVAESTDAVEGAATSTPKGTQTATLSGAQLTATAATPTATTPPTPTLTPLPPEPAAPPEAWNPQSVVDFESNISLKQDWAKAPEKNWEYEFLTYEDRQALLIQFTETEMLIHDDGAALGNVERETTLAIPDIEGGVSMVCRWDDSKPSGYAFRLTNQNWQLLRVESGRETELGRGNQTDNFREGNYETFRMRCQTNQLVIDREGEALFLIADNAYKTGAAGLRFEINEGIGLAFFTDDRVWAQMPDDVVAGEGDVVRLANLDIQFVRLNDEYDEMKEEGYRGTDVIGIQLRIDNSLDVPIQVNAQNFKLTDGQSTINGLDFVPESVGNRKLMPNIFSPGITTGEVFFSGVSPEDLEDWVFVIDLRYEGFGEAIFAFETN